MATAFMGGQAGYDEGGTAIAPPLPKSIAPTPVAPPVPGITPKLPTGPAPTPTQFEKNPDQAYQSLAQIKDPAQARASLFQLGGAKAEAENASKKAEAQAAADASKTFTESQIASANKLKADSQVVQDQLKTETPFAPTKENAADLAKMFSLITIATFGTGGKGQYHGMRTLAALNGMMEGYNAGKKDRFEQELKTYNENLASLRQHNETLLKKLDNMQKMYAVDKDKAEALRLDAIAQAGPGIVATALRTGRFQNAIDAATLSLSALTEQKKRSDDLKDKFAIIDKESKTRIAEKKLERELKFGPNVGGPQAVIYRTTGVELPPKDAYSVTQAGQALRAVDSLQQKLADPDVRTGLRAIPSSFFEKVKSLTDPAEINQAIDDLDANQKTVLALKDSLLVALTVEQARSGTRVPVFTQKTVGPILALTNYQPQTYNALLSERKDELYAIGGDNGLSKDAMAKVARITSEGQPAPAAPAAPTEQKQKATDVEVKEYANKYFAGNVQKAAADLKSKGYL